MNDAVERKGVIKGVIECVRYCPGIPGGVRYLSVFFVRCVSQRGASAMVEAVRPCVITCRRTISVKGAVAVSRSKYACRKDRRADSMVPLAWPSSSCISVSWGSVWCSRKRWSFVECVSLGRAVLG